MDFGISGKIAISGGGSKGMGRSVSIDLGREGCKVVVAARGQEAVDETVDAIKADGGEAIGVYANMTTEDGINKAVQAARDAFGDPDIAVSNVYGPTHGRWEQTTNDNFIEAFNDIVMSEVYLARAVVPAMKEKRWGRIVNINSTCSKEVHRELPLVTANVSRVATTSLNKSMADELGKFGITVNTVGPGGFATERYVDYMKKNAADAGRAFDENDLMRRDDVPVGRLGYPEEIAAMIVFLCSARASYITGQLIIVDGGIVRNLL